MNRCQELYGSMLYLLLKDASPEAYARLLWRTGPCDHQVDFTAERAESVALSSRDYMDDNRARDAVKLVSGLPKPATEVDVDWTLLGMSLVAGMAVGVMLRR